MRSNNYYLFDELGRTSRCRDGAVDLYITLYSLSEVENKNTEEKKVQQDIKISKMAPGLVDSSYTTLSPDTDLGGKEAELKPLCQIITPIGMLGYGFDEDLTRQALEDLATSPTPTALILDSGSTDGGPLKLALGSHPTAGYRRDWAKLMALGHEFKVPIIIGSAGGDGSDASVDMFVKIIEDIAEEEAHRYI